MKSTKPDSMHRLVTLCSVLLLFANVLFSQQLPTVAVKRPNILDKPYTGVEKSLSGPAGNSSWTVYSDRANNRTYTSPGGSLQKETIQFMDRFYVAERDGDYLHLYRDPNVVVNPNQIIISTDARSYGWIHMDKLLLWNRSLLNRDTQIDKKAMLLNTIEGLSASDAEAKLVEFKQDPGFRTRTGIQSRLFEIYHVYKVVPGAVLLGQASKVSGNVEDVPAIMKGWVPIGKTTFWDHRITLEPNWESRAFIDRNRMNIKPSIFSDARAAYDYQQGNIPGNTYTIWANEPGLERNIGQWRRFPILSIDDHEIAKVGAMGSIARMSTERFADIQEMVEQLDNKRRKINLVFVVDGTESMIPYFKPIANAINNSVRALRQDNTRNRYRFGAVIYRDYAEGDNLTDQIALTTDHNSVTQFLENARTDFSQDEDNPEALYYGLKKALTSSGFSKNESNFIILVGDAGNHDREDASQVSIETILQLSSRLECNIISFQAHSKNHPSYQEFVHQTRNLVLETAKMVHQNNMLQEAKFRVGNYTDPFFGSDGPNRYSLNDQEVVGSFLFPDHGKSLDPAVLQKEIQEKIKDLDLKLSRDINTARSVINNKSVEQVMEVDRYNESVINFLAKIQGLSKAEIDYLMERNVQFSMDGYTSLSNLKLNYPVFKHVLFLSVDELIDLVDTLNELVRNSQDNASQRRRNMQSVWLNILKSLLGDLNEAEILSMSMLEINQIAFGLPAQSEFIRNVRLQDITDPAVLSDTDFEKYFDYLLFRSRSLTDIAMGGYEYSFTSNGVRYYWIPIEEFP